MPIKILKEGVTTVIDGNGAVTRIEGPLFPEPKPAEPRPRASRTKVATEVVASKTTTTKRTHSLADLTRLLRVPEGSLFTFADEVGNVVEMRAGSSVCVQWTVTK